MNRRTVCRTAAAGLMAGVAGCTSIDDLEAESTDNSSEEATTDDDSEPDDDPQPDADHTDTNMTDDETTDSTDRIDSNRVAGASFNHTGDCSDPETATVEFLDSGAEVVITGCIEGRNGCAVPILVDGSDDDHTLHIEIGEVDVGDDDTICTQAITQLGYELRVRFDSAFPETIEVYHDGAVEQGVVATASPA